MNNPESEYALKITSHSFNASTLETIKNNIFVKEQWPFVYILSNQKIGEAYVGETANTLSRLSTHLANPLRKDLNILHLIWSDMFNKSATLDIESNLIKYLSADGRFKLQNLNAGQLAHNYYQKAAYQSIFLDIWDNLSKADLTIHSPIQIDNSDLFKYSPYKELTLDQFNAVRQILGSILSDGIENIFIQGSAGTGKTVLAVYLIKLLCTSIEELKAFDIDVEDEDLIKLAIAVKGKYPDLKIGLVVPMSSLRSTIKKVFKHVKGLKPAQVIGPSGVFAEDYDILIIDEAHRLRQRKNITNFGGHDQNNKKLGLGNEGTELDWITAKSKKRVLFYDPRQSIKPSDVRPEQFNALISKEESNKIELVSQLRVKGGVDYIDFSEKLLTTSLPDNTPLFQSKEYDFLLFDSFTEMVERVKVREKQFGLCRIVSGYSWKWISKNPNKNDIEIEGLKYNWNVETEDWINSKNAFDEVGCIHTTQGYDLNYAAIIFGTEIIFNKSTQRIEVLRENYHDRNGKNGIERYDELHNYIVNIYRTLMLRGIRGTYIYVCDKDLREYFRKYVPVFETE